MDNIEYLAIYLKQMSYRASLSITNVSSVFSTSCKVEVNKGKDKVRVLT